MSTGERPDRSVYEGSLDAAPPRPLAMEALESVPGVLGTIARERAADYRASPLPAGQAPVPARPRLVPALTGRGISVIAEVKRASPSRGPIADVDPVELAGRYERAGASAISVLTEARHFQGSLEHLRGVARTVKLPVLRKDFVVHPLQVAEARAAGASAVLLIAAVLGTALRAYLAYVDALGLDALVEVHDEAELEGALDAGARVLGVNNRDLRTLRVDLGVAPRLLALARERGFDGVAVAESGYGSRDQLARLDGLADAILVGSSLAASPDPGTALQALLGPRPDGPTI
jgi:indole-3-glycerol phosphate synthase